MGVFGVAESASQDSRGAVVEVGCPADKMMVGNESIVVEGGRDKHSDAEHKDFFLGDAAYRADIPDDQPAEHILPDK